MEPDRATLLRMLEEAKSQASEAKCEMERFQNRFKLATRKYYYGNKHEENKQKRREYYHKNKAHLRRRVQCERCGKMICHMARCSHYKSKRCQMLYAKSMEEQVAV